MFHNNDKLNVMLTNDTLYDLSETTSLRLQH